MALINCPECNHAVSDKAEKCPNCGYQLLQKSSKTCPECGNIVEINEVRCPNCGYQLNKNIKDILKYKKSIVCCAIILLIIIVGGIIIKNNVYNENTAIKLAVREVQSHLLDPSSMIIYECRYLPVEEDENYREDKEYVYIYAGAKNKGGGVTDEYYMVCLLNGEVESFADSDDASKQDVLVTGNSAASNLWFYLYIGTDSWKVIDIDKASKYIK